MSAHAPSQNSRRKPDSSASRTHPSRRANRIRSRDSKISSRYFRQARAASYGMVSRHHRSNRRVFFGRAIRIAMEEHGPDYPLSCIAPTLQSVDIVVANLEGPITSADSRSVGTTPDEMGHYTFTFPTSTVGVLFRHNIRLVNLGNNHIMNFGRDGLLETKVLLESGGIGYFGDPDVSESERVARVTIGGVHFSFVNWSDWTPIGKPPASNGASELNPVAEQIRKEA